MGTMARGSNGAGGVLVLAFVVVAGSFLIKLAWAAFVMIVMLSAPVLFGAWLIAVLNVLPRRAPPGRNAFVFRPEEQAEVARLSGAIAQLEGQERALLAQGAKLSTRNDGYFQERSDLARTLNVSIRQLRPQIDQARRDLQAVHLKPDKRKRDYLVGVARMRVLSISLIVAIVAMNVLMYAHPDPFVAIAIAMDDLAKIRSLPPMLIASAAAGSLLGWAFYAIRISAQIEVERGRIETLANVSPEVAQRYAATL
jgi:hypothetical protein